MPEALRMLSSSVTMSESPVLIVFCTCPDEPSAKAVAQRLVGDRLAACVSLLPSVVSVYRWKDQVETDKEVLLWIKTTSAAYASVETAIRSTHPYELPEIIAVESALGLPDYLQWVHDSCSASS